MKKYAITILCLLHIAVTGFCQSFKVGDRVMVQWNGSWTKAVIVKAASGSQTGFQVKLQEVRSAKNTATGSLVTVPMQQIKVDQVAAAVTSVKPEAAPNTALIGRYQIFTGIQKNYIGHFYLSADGSYRVALHSDEETYAAGTYQYVPETQSVKWLSGLFFQNRWEGKLVKQTNGDYQIIFNGKAIAEKAGK
jgi:ribosomal protein L21E